MRSEVDAPVSAAPPNLWRSLGLTFFATVALQASTLITLAIAGFLLPVEEFAKLSVIVSIAMFSVAVFELGLGVTATRMFRTTGDERFLSWAAAVQLGCALFGLVAGALVFVFLHKAELGLGIVFGGLMNLWNGGRTFDQARQDFASFTKSSLAFAVLRLGGGSITAWATRDGDAIAFALFAAPLLAMLASKSFSLFTRAFQAERPALGVTIGYAAYVYLNTVFFTALSYMPQIFIVSRADDTATATYGLVLALCAPIGLVTYSIRGVLLPRFTSSGDPLEKQLWSLRTLIALGLAWCLTVAAASVAGVGVHFFYGAKYPELALGFLIFFAGASASSLIGLYSLSVHTLGVPHLSMWITLVRFVVLSVSLFYFGHSFVSTVAISAALLALGEAVHVSTLWWVRKRQFQRSAAA